MVVLGGLGSVWGSVLGATMLWTLPVLLQQYFPDIQRYRMLAFGAVMCAMMVVKPDGLLGKRANR
jgi:branched-chain amino acid transport system permease protein